MQDSCGELVLRLANGSSIFAPPGEKEEAPPVTTTSSGPKELISPCLSATSLGASRTTSLSDLRDQPSLDNLEMASTWSPQSTSVHFCCSTPSPTPRSAVAQRRVSFGKTQVIIIAPRTPSPPCATTMFPSPSACRGGDVEDNDALRLLQAPPMSPIPSYTVPPTSLGVLNSHGATNTTRSLPPLCTDAFASSAPCLSVAADPACAPQGRHEDDAPTPSVSGRASPAAVAQVLRSASAVLKVVVSPIAAIRMIVRSDGSLSPGCSQPSTN